MDIAQFSQFLKDHLDAEKTKNPRASLRSYAKKIDISPSSLSELLSGNAKWKLTSERANQIVGRMGLKKSEEKRVRLKFGLDVDFVEGGKREIQPGNYDALTDWAVFPILIAHDLGEKTPSVAEMAARLEIPEERVKSIIAFLLDRGFLEKSKDGRIQKSPNPWSTTDNVPNAKVRIFHQDSLSLAQKAIEKVPTAERDCQAVTFSGSRAQLQTLKKEIRELCAKAPSLMNMEEDNDEVYRLQIALFPLDFRTRRNT